jgi:hypothetical protein
MQSIPRIQVVRMMWNLAWMSVNKKCVGMVKVMAKVRVWKTRLKVRKETEE